jgi:hypothetical protein
VRALAAIEGLEGHAAAAAVRAAAPEHQERGADAAEEAR